MSTITLFTYSVEGNPITVYIGSFTRCPPSNEETAVLVVATNPIPNFNIDTFLTLFPSTGTNPQVVQMCPSGTMYFDINGNSVGASWTPPTFNVTINGTPIPVVATATETITCERLNGSFLGSTLVSCRSSLTTRNLDQTPFVGLVILLILIGILIIGFLIILNK